MYAAHQAAARGSRFHALAEELIRMGVKLPRTSATLNMYVNDAIGYRMIPEQVLFYSEFAYGTCDAISFRHNKLRIHDLKMGVTPASVEQLEVYAAYFSLEYDVKPHNIDIELRIYQNDERFIFEGDPDKIAHIMDRAITGTKILTERAKGERL